MHKLSLAPFVLMLPGVAATAEINPGGLFISNFDYIMGTSLTIKVTAPSRAVARQAEQLILSEIDRLEAVLSSYRPDSEFSQWLAAPVQEAVAISADLFAVLTKFDHWRERTNGAINAAAEHLGHLWNFGNQPQPAETDQKEAVALVSQKHWQLDSEKQTATRLTQVPLRLNTFAKSYVLDRAAAAAFNAPGVDGLVLNSGGDILVRGNWQEFIYVANPRADAENAVPLARLQIQNAAVATSGDYRRRLQIGENWASHIMDPRTGLPACEIISATVIHPDPVTAGALATAFNVVTTTERETLTAQLPGTEYFLINQAGQNITSKGWPGVAPASSEIAPVSVLSRLTTAHVLSISAKDKLWNPKQELLITLELARIAGRSHRPFVAVWIEDEGGKPVRQLALWYNKPKWLRDLRQWNSLRIEDATSVTSATRSPGQYTLTWDGKDDSGNLVKLGKYTVMIEAAREHGTYQLIKETLDFNGKEKKQTLKGNVEITAAALDYRQKTAVR